MAFLLAQIGFPVGDWQFWIATGVVTGVICVVLWKVLPIRAIRARRQVKKRRSKATLTIGGKPLSK